MHSSLIQENCDISTKEIWIIDEFLEMIKKTYNVEYMNEPTCNILTWGNAIVSASTYKFNGTTPIELFKEFSQAIETDYIAIYKFGIIRTEQRNFFTIRLAKCPNITIGDYSFSKEFYDDILSMLSENDFKNFLYSKFESAHFKHDDNYYTITKQDKCITIERI